MLYISTIRKEEKAKEGINFDWQSKGHRFDSDILHFQRNQFGSFFIISYLFFSGESTQSVHQ